MTTRKSVPTLALGLALAILAGGCQTIPVNVETVPTKPAVKIADRRELAPIQFDRVGFNLRRGTVIGSYKRDLTNCSHLTPDNVFWNSGRLLQRNIEFGDAFFDRLSAANFNVVGDPKELFQGARREEIKPEYLVGAQVEDIRMNVCARMDFWTGRPAGTENGEASMRVSWQVFSVFDRKVVYETETKGTVNMKESVPDGELVLITEAFSKAVDNLAADAALVGLLKKRPRDIADVRAIDKERIEIPARPLFAGPIADNIDAIRRAVVTLDDGAGHGSGFFISPTLILTNRHVATNNTVLRVQLVTGRKVLGEVIRRHPERDVALVQVEAAGYLPLPLRREPLTIAEDVYAIGSPLDKELAGTVTKGIVSKFGSNTYGLEDIQADVDIQGGNSGGPLLDAHGNVVGLSYAGLNPSGNPVSIGLNFFIPIYDALDKLNVAIDRTRGRVIAD